MLLIVGAERDHVIPRYDTLLAAGTTTTYAASSANPELSGYLVSFSGHETILVKEAVCAASQKAEHGRGK